MAFHPVLSRTKAFCNFSVADRGSFFELLRKVTFPDGGETCFQRTNKIQIHQNQNIGSDFEPMPCARWGAPRGKKIRFADFREDRILSGDASDCFAPPFPRLNLLSCKERIGIHNGSENIVHSDCRRR